MAKKLTAWILTLALLLSGAAALAGAEGTVDKSRLQELVDQLTAGIQLPVVTPRSILISRAKQVLQDPDATQSQVDQMVRELEAESAPRLPDPRYTLENASWNREASDGEIVVFEGWNVFRFAAGQDKWIGICDPDLVLQNASSVTYEYEIYFDTDDGNDRCFLSFGDTRGWHGIAEGAPEVDGEGYCAGGNGFAQAGQWGPVPPPRTWGVISIRNDHYDPTVTLYSRVTRLGSWVDNGSLYLRSVRVYDNDDPSKYILLRFNEDVNELILTPGSGASLTEAEGETVWRISDGGELAVNFASLYMDDVAGGTCLSVKLSTLLEGTGRDEEALTVGYVDPEGNPRSLSLPHARLDRLGDWYQYSFHFEDFPFDREIGGLWIRYGGGEAVDLRGIQVCAADERWVMTGPRPARWGVVLPYQPLPPRSAWFFDGEEGTGGGMAVRFAEAALPHKLFDIDFGRPCTVLCDEDLYVTTDSSLITPEDRYVRIDITHQNGARLYLQYNAALPQGAEEGEEYRLRDSRGPEGSDPLGMILPVSDQHANWTTTGIYLSDAAFRNAADGADFRIRVIGPAAVSQIEAVKITEEEYNAARAALGDMTRLRELLARVEAAYPDVDQMPDGHWEVYDAARKFADEFGYRAGQEEVEEITDRLYQTFFFAPYILLTGDADGDGKITSTDARLTLQIAVGKISESDIHQPMMLDVDGDGSVTSTDARLILQKSVGKITDWP